MADNNSNTLAGPAERPLGERAKELAADAGREVLEEANRRGKTGMSAMGKKLEEAADYVDSTGKRAVHDGNVPGLKREHVEAVAGGMQHAADYLREKDPKSLLQDIDQGIQKHPYRAMAIGFGVGWLVGRLFRGDR
ncbi:MAG: hypothetical protein U1E65_31940 [Myxococcota bacterium]